jgi:hypothetical protein
MKNPKWLLPVFVFISTISFVSAQTGGNYQITQSVIASGGGQNSTGGNFSLDGTIGQPIAGTVSTGSSFSVSGGFWQTVFNPNGVAPPSIFKSFSPSSINVNETTTLTITLINPSSNTVALTGVGVTDAFPSGLQVDAVPAATNTCGGTLTAQAGAGSISLSDGVIAIGGFCTVSATVRAMIAGEKINTTGAVTSTNGGTGGTATATLTVNQPAVTYSVSGAINYSITSVGQTPAPVSGVSLNAAGTSILSTTNDLSGNYQLSGLTAGGNYTVTPSKSGEVKGINSLDATRIQQHRVGLITLTANQLIAADTDNSGTVNSLDATRIQQRLVGIQSSNIIGQWKFVPSSKQYNSINSNRTGENYEAVLVGEVSGNWATASSFADDSPTDEDILPKQEDRNKVAVRFENEFSQQIAERIKQSADSPSNESKSESAVAGVSVAVSLPANASATTGSSIIIPVTIGAVPAGSPIESFDFTVFYDPAVLQPASFAGSNAGTLSANCSVLANSPLSGRVVVSGACATVITTASGGVLYNLQFNVIGTSGQKTGLLFNNPSTGAQTFQFNSGNPAANTTNGLFTVLPEPTAAGVNVSGRVITAQGRGIRNVQVTMTDSAGRVRTTQTSSFGYYKFETVAARETVTISAKARRFKFSQSSIVRTTNESVSNADFVSEQ